MAVVLSDYVPALKREVQPPGTDLFAGVTTTQWVGYLGDAFWEARLDGFLASYYVYEEAPGDPNAEVRPVTVGGSDITRQELALVILYAGVKVLRNKILNTTTSFSAKAGPVEFEQQNSATMLVEMLKQLKATKDRILEELDELDRVTDVLYLDAYSTRLFNPISYSGGIELSG